jgi:hypothetical protein
MGIFVNLTKYGFRIGLALVIFCLCAQGRTGKMGMRAGWRWRWRGVLAGVMVTCWGRWDLYYICI